MNITLEVLAAGVSLPAATTRLTCSVADGATTAAPPSTQGSVTNDENGWASFRDTSLDTDDVLEQLTLAR